MTHSNFREPVHSRASFPIRVALATFVFVGAQSIAPHLGNQFIACAQSSSKQSPPSKTQRLANPLNNLLDEARRDIDKNEFEAAIAPLQKVIADHPEFAYAHFQLAYVYTALKKTREARTEYERTIALDPKMSEAYLNLGMLLLDNREDAAAVAPLRKAVDLLPAQSRPRYLLAVALDRSGDQVGAAESFQALLHLDPNDISAIDYLGWAALRAGQPAEAGAPAAAGRGGGRGTPPPPPPIPPKSMPKPVEPIVSGTAPTPDPRVGLSAGWWPHRATSRPGPPTARRSPGSQQAPEQQDVADLYAPQSGSAAVRALISISKVAPIGVAMGASALHVTDERASWLRILEIAIDASALEGKRHIDKTVILEDRASRA